MWEWKKSGCLRWYDNLVVLFMFGVNVHFQLRILLVVVYVCGIFKYLLYGVSLSLTKQCHSFQHLTWDRSIYIMLLFYAFAWLIFVKHDFYFDTEKWWHCLLSKGTVSFCKSHLFLFILDVRGTKLVECGKCQLFTYSNVIMQLSECLSVWLAKGEHQLYMAIIKCYLWFWISVRNSPNPDLFLPGSKYPRYLEDFFFSAPADG